MSREPLGIERRTVEAGAATERESAALLVNQEKPFPPLQSLRAVEACARLRSFTKAAKELAITPSAVTHHIRTMEKWAGAPLFERSGRRILPIHRVHAALPSLRDGFSRLADGARILQEQDDERRTIAISTAPSFASKWLLPRIDRFRAAYPTLEAWISADLNLVDFARSDVDLAIRYGGGRYAGLQAEQLLPESVVPVASPAAIQRFGPFKTPADLLNAPLIHDLGPDSDPSCPDWAMWLRARGVHVATPLHGPRHLLSSSVIDEAVAGTGVALAKSVIAAGDIAAGRLKPLFGDSTPLASGYWIVWPQTRALTGAATHFVQWLREELESEFGPRD